MIDILTLNYNDANSTINFVESIKKFDCVNHILIVDNKSTDDSVIQLKKVLSSKTSLICTEKNGGYGYGNNCGIQYLKKKFKSKFILLANPDVLIEEKTLISLENFLSMHKNYAIVAPLMLNTAKREQYNTAFRIPNIVEYLMSFDLLISKFFKPFFYKDIDKNKDYLDVGAVSGSLFLMDVDKMIHCGMFDEGLFLYCEEHVLGIKMKNAGYKTALLPKESFIHVHSVSINKSFKSLLSKNALMSRSRLYVLKKYYTDNPIICFLGKFILAIRSLEISILSLKNK